MNVSLVVHEGVKEFKCGYCNKDFSKGSNLKEHVKRVHGGVSNSYECDFCAKSFSKIKDLKNHIIETHQEKQTNIDL